MSGIDLHAHTTASDGTLAPAELVREAARRGVRVLAITDHDSTEGVTPALAEATRHPPLEIVPGIEINTEVDGAEVHVLGYFLDGHVEPFSDSTSATATGVNPHAIGDIDVDEEWLWLAALSTVRGGEIVQR